MFIGDVGGNVYTTATEHLDLGAPGANYAWPNCESNCPSPPYTNGIYNYAHNGRDACIVAGFVYHGTQFPSSYEGSFFLADYAQNWIKRLTLDANGNVTNVFNFQPPDGRPDGPYGSIVDLKEGPDGALYYLDIGFDDNTHSLGTPKLRRIRYVQTNLPPMANSSADVASGPPPLTVNFSSARLVRSGRAAAVVQLDVRRRHDVHRSQSIAHLRDRRSILRSGSSSPTASPRRSPRPSRSPSERPRARRSCLRRTARPSEPGT